MNKTVETGTNNENLTPLNEEELRLEVPKLRQAFLSEINQYDGFAQAQRDLTDAEYDEETRQYRVVPGTFSYRRDDETWVKGYSDNLFGFNMHIYLSGKKGEEYVYLGFYKGNNSEDSDLCTMQYANRGPITTNTKGTLSEIKSVAGLK